MRRIGGFGDEWRREEGKGTYLRHLDREREDLGERKMRSGGLFQRRRVGLLPFWLFAWL